MGDIIKRCLKPVLIWLGLTVMIVAIYMVAQNFLVAGKKVEATIVDKSSQVEFYSDEEAKKQDSSTYMQTYLKFTYEYNGRKYTQTTPFYEGKKGDVVKIVIDPKNPESILDSQKSPVSIFGVLIIAVISGILTFVLNKATGTASHKKKNKK